jgi:N-acetyl-anhydromuramyl-L-alanine amidase AmpD
VGRHLIIAGAPYLKLALPDRVPLTTFLDPGGYSFYAATGDRFQPLVGTNEFGERQEVVSVRSVPGGALRPSLGGLGWGAATGDPLAGLRTVVHSVVLHHDGCFSPDACYRTLVSRCLSTHVMIGRDGHVYQAADLADRTYHAGSMNNVAIGIDLNNRAHNLLSEPHAELDGGEPSPVRTINGGSFRSWNYTEAQYASLVEVLRVLVDALGIEPVFPMDEQGSILYSVVDSPPAEAFKGFLCHWHITPQKWDPGPGLDWEAILAGLRRNAATVPVLPAALADELDPAELPGVRVTREDLADPSRAPGLVDDLLGREATAIPFLDAICRTIERRQDGGFYPVGVNQTWHGGIHLEAPAGTPVRPLLKGELVAAHLVPSDDHPEVGSNNFVLLRHRIPLPPRTAPGAGAPCRFLEDRDDPTGGEGAPPPSESMLTVYSLYMHLAGVDFENPGDNALANRFQRKDAADAMVDPPRGPGLEVYPGADQGAALRAGYIGLFSPVDDPAGRIEVGPSEVIGHVGGLRGTDGETRSLVHVEVFADDAYLEAMEMALYGRFLQVGPQDPDARDLVVRSVPLLTRMLPPRNRRGKDGRRDFGDKVLTADQIRDWYQGDADPEDLEVLRSLVVGHLSEWSDQVEWIRTLLADQAWWQSQGTRLINPDRVGWVFARELSDWLRFAWLTDDVSKWIGLKPGGMVHTFHPIRFIAWWMYLRSAVRAKSLDEILRCLKGHQVSLLDGVPDVLGDRLDLGGPGQWES